MELQGQNGASGVCVTDTGEVGGRLLGVVAGRDVDGVVDRRGSHLRDVMTTCVPWAALSGPDDQVWCWWAALQAGSHLRDVMTMCVPPGSAV